ncbi:pilus assembly protein [Halopseudomonas yangmingensis]|uniref:Type IV pilus assembly protein PilY1 n=1 Tax=Halopseudomonas yangmingensis TaxID=1720063 RepID=A0A1I4P0Z5_9GAMM|nr:PilC/PilY family type IV pilus protein [Halopseudomonas yangmingensis]SFM21043.1 type IV pilus assembly protein PilY1 [Halopseudomonas yangmingensis]
MSIKNFFKQTILSSLAFGMCLQGATAYASLDVSQQPLMLVDSVPPNLILTLDDSGSMRWAFVPDSMGTNNNSIRNARRSKSSSYNPMYYNPAIDYLLPVKIKSDGTVDSTGYTTNFTAAKHNGFNDLGVRNLSSDYRVSWNDNINVAQSYTYDSSTGYASPTGTIFNLARNPESDFRAQCSRNNDGACPTITTTGGMIFNISRTSSGCTATATFPDGGSIGGVNCSRSGSTMTVDLTGRGVPAYYYRLNDTAACRANPDNDNCYTLVRVSSNSGVAGRDERQNFAIWYSFYRNRALATLSAANLAFNELPPSIRFTWQSLGNCTTLNSSGCNTNRFRAYSGQHKYNFFEWMNNLNFDQSTPLRAALDRAGKFLQDNSTAWAYNPNPIGGTTVTNPVLACRPSYHIMMTDGMWNGADGNPSGTFRHDARSFTLPDGTSYSGSRNPYYGAASNTLADLAMHYWATDLRPTIDNDLKPFTPFPSANKTNEYWDPRNNPADWQHMVNFMVGLALTNSMQQPGIEWAGGTFEGTGYQNLANGTNDWPVPSANSENNVYDLWHAAINSRGEFYSADSPESLVQSFKDIIGRIAERSSVASKPGVSSSVSLDPGLDLSTATIQNRILEAKYDSQSGWSGDLIRRDVSRLTDGSIISTQVWNAASQLTSDAGRTILMAGTSASGLKEFNWSNLNTAQRAPFNINPDGLGTVNDGKGQDRVNFVRGSRALEGTSNTSFRERGTTVLGDIINSSPVVVGRAENVPFLMDRIDGSSGDYLQYMDATVTRPELVYVGANDGMLHAFNLSDGSEAFAFIPSEVLPKLPKLSGKSFVGGGHQFYVDGTPVVRDVYFDGAWRTVLIGTLRAGGRSVFALDITDPGVNGAGVKLLWEISNTDTDYADLGYSFARPEIARLHSGQWGVLLGNGYDSTDGKAVLYVIDVATGTRLSRLEVDNGSSGDNGLSSVRGADNNSDGIVDYAYAGDLKGNVWRFDLVNTGTSIAAQPDPFSRTVQTGISPSSFKVSFGGNPLFKASAAGQPQPITGLPSLVRHPTGRGYLVIVGTGKYFETSDAAPDTSKPNTVYGIWDRHTRGENTSAALASATLANMEQQTITQQTSMSVAGTTQTVRTLSDNSINWYTAGTTAAQENNESRVNRRGWYLDLAVSGVLEGEMLINDMLARGGVLLFSTITPNQDPCADGLNSMLYAINANTGGRLPRATFDVNRDGKITEDDYLPGETPPSALDVSVPGGVPLTRDGLICDNTGLCISFEVPPSDQGRTSWQQLPAPGEE